MAIVKEGVVEIKTKENIICNDGIAILSSFDKYTTFSYGETKLTLRTCDGLERYTSVRLWDKGYIEVMAKYKHEEDELEKYIDLIPVLENLYMDKDSFLKPIKGVRIEYA